jgi:hypothetical protein
MPKIAFAFYNHMLHHSDPMEQSVFWGDNCTAEAKYSPSSMRSDRPLECSQKAAIGPYSESNPHAIILFL